MTKEKKINNYTPGDSRAFYSPWRSSVCTLPGPQSGPVLTRQKSHHCYVSAAGSNKSCSEQQNSPQHPSDLPLELCVPRRSSGFG